MLTQEQMSKHRQGNKVAKTLQGEVQKQLRSSVARGKINPQKTCFKMGHN